MATSSTEVKSLAASAHDQVVKKLGELAESISSRFSCGGVLSSPSKVQLFFKGSSELAGVVFPGADEAAIQQLLSACSVASFGMGSKQVTDKSYRDAFKLEPDQFATTFQLCDTPILGEIQMLMVPNVCTIQAELYKLNIYAPGGHFKAHVDTPRSEQMFGSLVVCLPTQFSGGALVTRHVGREIPFDWSSSLQNPLQNVCWASFFSDVEHEVLPVTEGYRITLTYNLYSNTQSRTQITWADIFRSGGVSESDCSYKILEEVFGRDYENAEDFVQRFKSVFQTSKVESIGEKIFWGAGALFWGASTLQPDITVKVTSSPFYGELRSTISNPHFMRDGGVLGFSCHHAYVFKDLNVAKNLPCFLKGADQIVYVAAKSLGLPVIVKPIIMSDGERVVLPEFPKFQWVTGVYFSQDVHCTAEAIVREIFGSRETCLDAKITWCQKLTQFQPAAAYATYGNNPACEVLYQAAAILVGVPKWGEREIGAPKTGQKFETTQESEPSSKRFKFDKYDNEVVLNLLS